MASGSGVLGEVDFLKPVVAFPAVAAGDEREALLRAADLLCAELGYPAEAEEAPGARSLRSGDGMAGVLSPQDESLVAELRRKLAGVAAAAGPSQPDDPPEGAVGAALDGMEMVIRGELVSGNLHRLALLMPSFVFLVTLPIVAQDEALRLSRRTGELVAAELRR